MIPKNVSKKSAQSSKLDYIREVTALLNLEGKWFPKFTGFAVQTGETSSSKQTTAVSKPAIVTSYIPGKKFSQIYKDLIEDSPEVLIPILFEIVSAISFLHERSLYHGDLSLNNVMVDYDEDLDLPPSVYLIDFGLTSEFTNKKAHGFTPDFWSFEMIMGGIEDISKIDVYAIGAIIFNVMYSTPLNTYLFKRVPTNQYHVKEDGKDFYRLPLMKIL